MEKNILDGAIQYKMNAVIGKFYTPRISNKQTKRASGMRN
jgi:hypothetical protein